MNRLCHYSSFGELSPSYRTFFQSCTQQGSPFLSLPWFLNWSKTGLNARFQLRIYGLETDERSAPILAAMPMCHKPAWFPLLQSRVLRGAANYYSAQFGPIINSSDTRSPQHLALLINAITAESPPWDIIDLHPLQQDCACYGLLMQTFANAGMAVESYFCSGNWYLKVANRSYQHYFDSLPSRLKNTLLRKTAQLNKQGRLRLGLVSSVQEARNLSGTFREIYEHSWKQAEPSPDFISGWIMESAQQGWLRMGVAWIDDQPAAMQIWLVHQNKACIYKLAHDERYRHFSVGSILTAHLLEHVIDTDHVEEVDFLNGDESYKQDWMSDRREYWGIIAYSRQTFKGQFACLLQKSARQIKRYLTAK